MPILGICYGQQTLCHQLGGKVEGGHHREFGRAYVEILKASPLFEGFWESAGTYPVWMSHGDRVTVLPEGFEVIATSANAPFAIAADEKRRYYTTMFHPEVVHTPDGAKLLANFVHNIAGLEGRLDDGRLSRRRPSRRSASRSARARVICGLSGGVDSSVAAVLIHEAIGDQLTCIFVDHGLMRKNEADAGRLHVPRPLQHPAGPCRRRRPVHRRAGGRDRPRDQAQDHRPAVHRSVRGRGARSSAAPSSWRRARSIPT